MSAVTEHLVRRAVNEFHGQITQNPTYQQAYDGAVTTKGNPWGQLLIVGTIIFFTVAICAVQYTYGELIAALAAVEAPTTTAIIRTAPENNEEEEAGADKPLIAVEDKKNGINVTIDEEVLLIKQKPLTSRFSTIRRHLRAEGGRGGRFRGIWIYILESSAIDLIVAFFSASGLFRGNLILHTASEVLAITTLTSISLWWNHWIISAPSSKRWHQRIPSIFQVRKAIGPTALAAAIQRFSTLGFFYLAVTMDAMPQSFRISTEPATPKASHQTVLNSIFLLSLGICIILGVQIPTQIAITRVRASLLAEEETPIIPFDRSFNGQVIPVEAGGSGMLGFWQAWKGTDRATRLRVLGVYGKTVVIEIALTLLGALAVVGEMRLLFGPEFAKKFNLIAVQMMKRH